MTSCDNICERGGND